MIMESTVLNVNVDVNSEEKGEMLLTANESNLKDKNVILAEGVIVNRFDTDKVTLLTITTLGGKKRNVRNFPNFVLSGETREQAKDYKKGDKVRIKGYARSQRIKNKETEGYEYRQSIYITEISLAKSILEQDFGISGRLYDMPYAQFRVIGEVAKVNILRNNIIQLVIHSTTDNGFSNYIEYVLFANDLTKLVDVLQPGKKVCAAGEIQTKKYADNGKTIHKQNNVILDIKAIA